MMRISRRESAHRAVEAGGDDGTRPAFADCARPPSRSAGRVAPNRIRVDVRSMEIGG
jgi:hypothetical protein